jgi:muconolactone delta-isomerase
MQFLTVSRRRVTEFPPEAFTPELVAGEGQRVREMHAEGKVLQVWRRGDTPGAAIVWEAENEEDLRAAVSTLPLFKSGLLEVVILVPLQPYPGL